MSLGVKESTFTSDFVSLIIINLLLSFFFFH